MCKAVFFIDVWNCKFFLSFYCRLFSFSPFYLCSWLLSVSYANSTVFALFLQSWNPTNSNLCKRDALGLQHWSEIEHSRVMLFVGWLSFFLLFLKGPLYSLISIKVKGIDEAVLKSYTEFITMAAGHLKLDISERYREDIVFFLFACSTTYCRCETFSWW